MTDAGSLTAASLLVRLELDPTTGIDAQLASKLTSAERAALASGERISKAQTVQAEKVRIAQLRVVSATERYNQVLKTEGVTNAQLARAEASRLSANASLTREQGRLGAATAQTTEKTRQLGLIGTATFLGALYVAERLAHAFLQGAESAAALQRAQAQTNVVLRDTHQVAGVTADDVARMATETTKLGVATDTQATQALNRLLQFTAIRGKVFDRAFADARDLAASEASARGSTVDLATAARSLGIALQDPSHGMDRLRRAGLALTAQQRENIKNLADQGHLVAAQSALLSAVEQKVAGSSQAFADSAEGSVARARIAFDELTRSLSTAVLPEVTSGLHDIAAAASFLAEHHTLRTVGLDAAALAAGLFVVHKAVIAIESLRSAETLGIIGRLFGYRTATRAITQLEAAEERHAASATRVAEAENAAAAATERSAAAAAVAADAHGAAAAAETADAAAATGATGRGFLGGLSARAVLGGVARGAGAIALGDILAEQFGPRVGSSGIFGAFHAGQNSAANDRLNSAVRQFQVLAGPGAGFGAGPIPQKVRGEALSALAFAQQNPFSPDTTKKLAQATDDLNAAYQRRLDYDRRISAAEGSDSDLARSLGSHIALLNAAKDAAATEATTNYNAALQDEQTANKRLRDAQKFVQSQKNVEKLANLPAVNLGAKLPTTDVSSALYSVHSASSSLAGARDAVASAEARLNAVRGDSKSTADQLRSAEDSLAGAKRREQLASERQTNAEKTLADKRKGTALDVKDVLQRFGVNAADEEQLAHDYKKLAKAGISEPVLAQLRDLEQQAPGTLDKVAAHITPQLVSKLDRDFRQADHARTLAEAAFAWAYVNDARLAAQRAADHTALAYTQALTADLRSPKFHRDVAAAISGAFPSASLIPDLKGHVPAGPQSSAVPHGLKGLLTTGINVHGNVVINNPTSQVTKQITRAARLKALHGVR